MKRHRPAAEAVKLFTCIECQAIWLDASERWRMYVTEDEPRQALLYCHLCAQREFGPFRTA